MHLDLHPIEKHKSEIERRINQLQQKFRQREAPKPHAKRNRDHPQDQNKAYNPPHQVSRTVEVRGRIKAQGEGKTNRESAYRPVYAKEPLSETGVIRNIRENKKAQNDGKDEKIKQLYEMMRLILEGQKNIEKQINQLKQQNAKQCANRSRIEAQTSFIQNATHASFIQNATHIQSSLDRIALYQDKNNQKSDQKTPPNNHSLIREQLETKQPKQNKPRQKKAKSKRGCDFEEFLQELKGQTREGHRYCVGEEWKARIWAEVEGRVKQSEKEYKDTIHRNNKHEYDHLINTFQLQRKLKDDLIEKVYQQCNPQIYK